MPAGDDFLRATLPALDLVHNLARRLVPGRAPYGGVRTELRLTEWPGHGTELASQAAIDGFSPIIVAGDNYDQGPRPDGRSVVV